MYIPVALSTSRAIGKSTRLSQKPLKKLLIAHFHLLQLVFYTFFHIQTIADKAWFISMFGN
jgi:hypothetical protein